MNSVLSGSDSQAAFDRLHSGLQRWIWSQGWPGLRPVQADAIPVVLARDADVVISAPTAGGKTEAAFLPVLSDLAEHGGPVLRCLCVSPLRALINDQTRRLESMCEFTDLTVQAWHGDVSAGRSTFWKRPAQVLLTTPESLEALLMRRSPQFGPMLKGLRYIVVDELHAFMGSERGAQLQSLLQRVERLAGQLVPRVALSATLGAPEVAASFLRPGSLFPSKVLVSQGHGGEIRIQARAIIQPRAQTAPLEPAADIDAAQWEALRQQIVDHPVDHADESGDVSDDQRAGRSKDRGYQLAIDQVSQHLFERLRGQSHLVFANARAQVELVADRLRVACEASQLPNEFFPHHGALSKELRVWLEERLRQGQLPTTAVCTSTLEMGIDIGDVTSIAQIGPAPSAASLKQRLGRSGRRRDQAQILRQYVILPVLDAKSSAIDWLRLPLLQAVATIELMLGGQFEPPNPGELHLSTLVQQILSMIMQRGGGASAALLYRDLCEQGAFVNVDRQIFAEMLRSLGSSRVLEQVADGSLLPCSEGERLVEHYSFYATFHTPEEYLLLAEGRRLGTVPIDYPLLVGEYLLFAGRRWQITGVDEDSHVVSLVPAAAGRVPKFGGGGIGQHRLVHSRMRELLFGEEMPAYLDATAQQALLGARHAANVFGFSTSPAYCDGRHSYLQHWSGSRAGTTLQLWLRLLGRRACQIGPILMVLDTATEELPALLSEAIERKPADPVELTRGVENLVEDKFDTWLAPAVLAKGYARRHVDLPAAEEVLRGWLSALPK